MDMKRRRKGAEVARPCDLCGSLVDERDLIMSEVQGLRGMLVCSRHTWEREARVRPSFQDRGGVGQVPDLTVSPIWPGGLGYPGGAQTLVRFAQTASASSFAETDSNATNYSNGDLTVEALLFVATGSAGTPRSVTNNYDFDLGRGWRLDITHGGQDPLFVFGNASTVTSLDQLITPDQLHRVSATKSEAGDVVLYVDGVETGTGTVSTSTQTFSRPLGLGGNYSGASASVYAVGDIRIFNVVRTAAEVLASWNVLLPPNTLGLVANYQTVEGTGDQLADACGGANMTITGGQGWTEEDF